MSPKKNKTTWSLIETLKKSFNIFYNNLKSIFFVKLKLKTEVKDNIQINGKTYSGRSVVIDSNGVIVNGEKIDNLSSNITVVINGDCDSVYISSGDITINGNSQTVTSTSGDVVVENIQGNVTVNCGDITANVIHGNASTSVGDINVHRI